MKRRAPTAASLAGLLCLVVMATRSPASSAGPQPGSAGVPAGETLAAEMTCTACHASSPLNPDGRGRLGLEGLPRQYAPAERYALAFRVTHPDHALKRWGFQLTAVAARTLEGAGRLVVTDPANTRTLSGPLGGRQYVQHTYAGTGMGRTGGHEWRFDWVAPAGDVGRIDFFASATAANLDGTKEGDRVFNPTPLPVASVLGPSGAGRGGQVKFWQSLSFTETDQLVELARVSEAVGFHGVLVSDHVFYPERLASPYPYSEDGAPSFGPETPWPEPFAAIAAMSSVTTRLRFVTAVYILPLRHPLEVAKAAATVAALSDGRLALGAGAGWMREEFDALGSDFATRGRRFDEMIAVLRKVWSGGMVEHHGEHYAFDRLQLTPAPPGPIPIYVGGASAAALRRAARLGDGWIGAGNDPDEVPATLARLREYRAAAGREGLPFESIVALTVPPDLDLLRRLEDQGMTSVVSWPLSYTLGPASSLDQKRLALESYGEDVIARAR